jgi:hypothetical protein
VLIVQTSGTAIFTHLYTAKGWRVTSGVMLAFVGTSILVLLARGPHETGWIGWGGGSQLLKRDALVDLSPQAITEGKRARGKVVEDGSVLEERKDLELGDQRKI